MNAAAWMKPNNEKRTTFPKDSWHYAYSCSVNGNIHISGRKITVHYPSGRKASHTDTHAAFDSLSQAAIRVSLQAFKLQSNAAVWAGRHIQRTKTEGGKKERGK